MEEENNMNNVLTTLNERGRLFKIKNELSKEVRSGQPGIDVEEFPVGMQSENNMNAFFDGSFIFKQNASIEAKKQINTDEYKLSVKNMNLVKQGFESMKNDLNFLADYKTRNWDNVDGISKQEPIDEVEFLQDLVVLPDNLDKTVTLKPDGSTIMGPGGVIIPISEMPKLTPANIGKSIEEGLNELIQREGRSRKESGGQFNSQLVRSEVKDMLRSLKDSAGIKGIKSAAYDAIVNVGDSNGSFMDNYFDQPDVSNNVSEWLAENPGADVENIKNVLLPTMWNHNNSNQMEKLLEDFFVVSTYENYANTEEIKPQANTPTAGMSAEEKLNYYRNLSK